GGRARAPAGGPPAPAAPAMGCPVPPAGCLLPAPRRVVERVGEDARIGLVVCGGNATVTDMAGWADRFGLR
ncbi:hypothetical protein ACFUAI_25395, partial [Streptomyces sp. NPDC057176]